MKFDLKRMCFASLLLLIMISVACSATHKDDTWTIVISYTPYTSISGYYYKSDLSVEEICREHLPAQLHSSASKGDVTICCDIENNWIAFDSNGNLLPSPPVLTELPAGIESGEKGFILHYETREILLTLDPMWRDYSNYDGIWSLEEIMHTRQ